ncbi:50S ribosomal protein L18e [Candidatus Woesearchaeota archaeon]|nr:50S ribosomal protein L18e [Candidatus Woesearchaeota archaeon]HIH38931.1 50S ribosomal protein L18e [Candidatus Woesearchaeota archaeon]HIH49352.1 50S ribosomal protein L18e [Candidatus Woesearchaeota archaeon]HIJ03142.1 50S ribosomal protein L18e [Candidatus Woesearchaeota archaeon]
MKGTTNPELQSLIFELKKRSLETKVDMWKKVASDLSRSQKNKRVVNLTKISKYAGKDETIVVPGKVLADGEITGKLKIAAYTYSTPALDKLKKAGAETLTLQELLASNPDPKKIRIIG